MLLNVSKYLQTSVPFMFNWNPMNGYSLSIFFNKRYWFSAIVYNLVRKIEQRKNEQKTIKNQCQTPIMIKCTMRNRDRTTRIYTVPHIHKMTIYLWPALQLVNNITLLTAYSIHKLVPIEKKSICSSSFSVCVIFIVSLLAINKTRFTNRQRKRNKPRTERMWFRVKAKADNKHVEDVENDLYHC